MMHVFEVPDIMAGAPVLRCANLRCRVVWWPDRTKPKSECAGIDPRTIAQQMAGAPYPPPPSGVTRTIPEDK